MASTAPAKPTGGGIDPVSAATSVASTISDLVLAGKQQNYLQALGSLDQRQQIELAEKLRAAQTDAERLQILSSSMTQYLIENDKQAKKSSMILYIAAGVLAVALLGLAIWASKTKSK
jgi:hypothetical protein